MEEEEEEEEEDAGFLEEHEVLNERLADRALQGAAVAGGDQVFHVNAMAMVKLVMESLALPLISAGVGEIVGLLASCTQPGSALERFLGINSKTRTQWGFADKAPFSGQRTMAVPSVNSSRAPANDSGFFRRLFSSSSSTNPRRQEASTPAEAGNMDPDFDAHDHGDVNSVSVHWRNTLSLFAYIVVSDACSLGYRYLRLSQRRKTRVVDRPFEGAELISGLDLK
jgi:hypothetical protein